MARTLCGWMPGTGISRAHNRTRAINLPLMELLVLMMLLCLCGCNIADQGESGMDGPKMGEPCRDISFEKGDDDAYVFMIPTPSDQSLPHHSQVPSQSLPLCLEDAEQCHHGFTASFNVTIDIETVSKGDDVIGFAPMFGHAPDADVVGDDLEMPLTLRLEDMNAMYSMGKFKVLMMSADLVWDVGFHSRLGHPMLVGVTWRKDIGLDVYVDGICAGFVEVPHRQNSLPEDVEEESKGGISSVLVTSFQFIDFLRPIDSLLDMASEDTLITYYLGCMDGIHTHHDLLKDAMMTHPHDNIVTACRLSCSMAPSTYAFVNEDQCTCGDEILHLDRTLSCGHMCNGYRSLPCGSRDKWGVYLTPGLITLAHHLKYETMFGMHLQPDGIGAPVVPSPPSEGRGRYKRSTVEGEDTVQHHVRHRRSAEFIEVHDVEGLSNTVLNITYVIQTDVTSLTCQWNFGDGSRSNQLDAEHGTQHQYQYNQAGVFTINVLCGDIQDSATVIVRSSIQGTGYTIQQYGSTTTLTDVILRVTRITGNVWPIEVLFILNEQEKPFVESQLNIFDATWTPTSFGTFQLDPVISNRIDEDISLSLNVTVGEPISGLTVRTSGLLGTYLPIQIIVEISGGSNVTVGMDFGNDNLVPTQILIENQYTWIQSYMTPGTKEISVFASNAFGTDSVNTSIDVPQSVTGLQMVVSPDVVSSNENIIVQLTAEDSDIPDVTCTIMTGDGREFIETDITLDGSFDFSVTFNYSQDFHNAVKVSATCSNAFSNQTVEKSIVVGRGVQSCSILTPDAQRVGDIKETVISVQGGNAIQLQIDFGDGSASVQASSDFPGNIAVNHSFSSVGMYNVTARVNNAVTSAMDCLAENNTIIVQENVPAESMFTLSATPNAIDLTVDNQINFTVTMDSSESSREDTYITFLFFQHCTCSLSIKLENHETRTGAIYNISGTYIVTAIISNRVSSVVKKIQVGAMYQMDDFTVTPPELALLVGELVVFTVVPLNGTEIRINITWDDGSHDFIHLESAIDVTFNHTYNVPGDYDVCVEALNGLSVSQIPECTTIQILHPVQGLDFGITALLVLDASPQFVIGLQSNIPVPSHMTCVIDRGDGTGPLTVSEGDLTSFPTKEPCGYTPAVKNYRATMHCFNVLGSSNHTLSVYVRKPIPEVFRLEVTEPFYFLSEALVEYTLSVIESDIPVGYAYFDWEFGDGNTSKTHTVMEDRTLLKRYRFTEEGSYRTNLTISYGSWSGLLTVDLVVAEKRSLDVVVEYASGDRIGQPGGGPNETWFYENQLLRFSPVPNSHDTIYKWRYSTDQLPSVVAVFDHRFETTGVFAVQVTAVYPWHNDTFVTFVHIVSTFDFQGIEVVDSGNSDLKIKAYSKLNITLMGTGLNSPLCILWVFCNETLYFSGPPNCYNAPYISGEPGIAWTTDGQILTHVEFNTPGIFNLTVIVTNNMESDDSTDSALKTITIVGCTGPPEVTLRGSGRTTDNPRRYLRSEQINLASTVRLRCFGLEETPQFQWSTTLLVPFEPNATSVDLDSNNLPDYTFPSLTFAVGLYNLSIKVTVTETSPPLSGIDFVFMNIGRTPVIVTIGGGSARTVNGLKDIQFDASGSLDPDETLDDQDLSQWNFTWSCYRVETDASPRPMVDSGRPICEYSTEQTIPDAMQPVFVIEELRLALGAKYIIKVTGTHSDGRSDSYEQAISTVPGEPVLAKIDCVQNCLSKVNPTSQVALQARCVNCRTQNASYAWEMKIGKETREEGDLSTKAATELSKSGLVIRANVLEGGEFYYVKVLVEEPGMIQGFTEVSFYTNLAPYGGSCDIDPRSGSALLTDFTVTCNGWKDEGDEPERPPPDQSLPYDPILRYRVQYRPQGKERWMQLVPAGELSIIPALKFATGPELYNYTLDVLFTVLDKFGGTDQRETTVIVEPVVISKAALDDLFSEGGDIDTLKQSKDPEAGYRTVEAIASVVESAGLDEDEKVDIKDKLLDVVTVMSPLAKTSDSILQSADAYSSLYNKFPPPSKDKALDAATSLEEVTANYANIELNNADDIKRTGDALIGSFGNMIASNLPPVSPSSTNASSSTSSSSSTMSPEENQSDEEEQRQNEAYESKMLSTMLLDVLEKVSDLILSKQVAGQEPAITKTDTLEVRSQVNNPEDIGTGDSPIELDGVQIGLPPAFDFFGEEIGQKLVAMKVIDFPNSNPYNYGGGSADIGSGVCSIEFQTDDRNKIEVNNTKEPISLFLKTIREPLEPVEIRSNISQRLPMSYHRINISEPHQDFRAIIETDNVGGVWVFAKLLYSPITTSYDVVKRLPQNITHLNNNGSGSWDPLSAEQARNTFVLTKEEHCGNGTYFIGIMPAGTDDEFEMLNSTTEKCSGEEARLTLPNDENTTVISLSYNFSSYSSSCRFFSNTTDEWNTEGCRTGVMTTTSVTHCLCNHLTSFAASFFVPPNKIDFSTVFQKNLLDNFAVMGTVIAFTSLYLLLLIYARRKDKQDIIKWGVTPLSDNHPAHRYAYQVTVETGVRPGAGTKSKVGIMISGEDSDTGARVLDDPKRPIFQAGSINSFLMTVPHPLGLLTYVRIWHDNSGGGGAAGWFLSKVAVMDIQTGKEFFFLCEQWLAVEQGDGDVDRTLFVASKKDLTKVGQLVYTSGRKNLSDQHLWFSLFSRPTRSSFNRCQRLCCCITLLYTSMIANAMFYRAEATAASTQLIRIGSFSITPQQISIGFTSSLIVMPVNMIIAQIFRKARPLDRDAPDPFVALLRRCFTRKKKADKVELLNFEEKRHDKAISEKQIEANVGSDQTPNDPSNDPGPSETSAAALAAKKKYPLPHWTIYIAYVLAFVACFISCFFTVLYSLEWGKVKAEEWLGSMITSFFSSAFVVQPVKVIVIVFIVSIIFKKPSKMNDADAEGLKDKTFNKLQTDEEYLHDDSLTAGTAPGYAIRPKTPPNKQILQKAREERLRDMHVSSVFKDCIVYSVFLVVVLFLAYTNRDPDSWNMSETIRNTFSSDVIDYLVDGEEPTTFSSLSHSTPDGYWNYIEQTLLPGLYGHKYYNGEDMMWRDARFLRDWQNYRVGPARLRQLRVKPLPCTVNSRMENAVKDCTLDYSWSNEDEGVFAENWTYTCDPSDENIPHYAYYEVDETRPWRYRSAADLYGVPYSSNLYIYGGGGYIAEFGINREQAMATAHYLRTHGWYDKYTRAIFIEFTVYNANINLFSVVTLLVETPTLGGGVTSTLVHTFRLYQYVGGLWIVSVAFQAIFCIYLLYFLGHFIYRLKKEGRKELKNIWMILEGSMLLFGLSSAAMFIMRQIFIQFTLQEVKKKDEGGYVNFNHIAKWDQIFGYLLAILTFLAILRFMRVLRFSSRVTHVAQALHRASRDMLYFLFMWCIIVVAFALWGYAVFSRSVFTFHTFQAVLESLLGMMIGSFDFYALSSVESVIGPIFFTLYIFAAYFMLANMLITIIVEAFCQSKADPETGSTFPIAKHITTKMKMVLATYGIGSNSVGPAPDKQAADKTPEDQDKKDEEDAEEGDDPAYQDMMVTIEKRVDQLITYVINYSGDGKGNKPMGSKATLNTFEAMVKKDIETVKQRKTRNIMVT